MSRQITETDLAIMAETVAPEVQRVTIRLYLLDCRDHSLDEIAQEAGYSLDMVRRVLTPRDPAGLVVETHRWEGSQQVTTYGPSRECLRDMVNARGAMLRDRGIVS